MKYLLTILLLAGIVSAVGVSASLYIWGNETRAEKILAIKDNCQDDSLEGRVAIWAVKFEERGVEPNDKEVAEFYQSEADYGTGTIIE